jgi:hypothetical protein
VIDRVDKARLLLGAVAVLAALGGCDRGHGTDYCKNHYAFHPNHLDTVGVLDIRVTEQGDFEARLAMPASAFGELDAVFAASLLGSADNVLGLQLAGTACAPSVDNVTDSAAGFDVTLTARCGAGNKLEQVDVLLFKQLPQLEEVVVSVTTPATAKYFAVNRKCDRPVFRLK